MLIIKDDWNYNIVEKLKDALDLFVKSDPRYYREYTILQHLLHTPLRDLRNRLFYHIYISTSVAKSRRFILLHDSAFQQKAKNSN
jgi:hypothetical protein